MRTVTRTGIAALVLLAGEATARAGEASEAVRPFYMQPGLELKPEEHHRFTDPALKVLKQNDAILAGGETEGCLDPALPFDDTDYNAEEVKSTLDLREVVTGDNATVVASFTADGGTRRVQWMLKRVDGAWKVADIISMTKDFALSAFVCE